MRGGGGSRGAGGLGGGAWGEGGYLGNASPKRYDLQNKERPPQPEL